MVVATQVFKKKWTVWVAFLSSSSDWPTLLHPKRATLVISLWGNETQEPSLSFAPKTRNVLPEKAVISSLKRPSADTASGYWNNNNTFTSLEKCFISRQGHVITSLRQKLSLPGMGRHSIMVFWTAKSFSAGRSNDVSCPVFQNVFWETRKLYINVVVVASNTFGCGHNPFSRQPPPQRKL